MQKYFYLSLFIFLFINAPVTRAQIPNPSFENWSNGVPVGWGGSVGQASPGSITQSSNAFSGSFAVRLNVVIDGILPVGSYLISYPNFPVASMPLTLHGWYIAEPDSGDQLSIMATTFTTTQSLPTGGGNINLVNSTSVYKEFVVNFSYATYAADSASIQFVADGDSSGKPHIGTYFIIDDLSLGDSLTTGINSISQPEISLEQNYPNPAMDNTNIIYTVQQATPVKLEIIDMLGRAVQTLVDVTQPPGRYKAIADVSNVAPGNYLYRLTEKGNVICKMMAVGR